jgi:hypothetical protein
MIWKIASSDNSVFARRLERMLGLEVCIRPEGKFDGLFFFTMNPTHRRLASDQYGQVPKVCYWTGSDAKQFLDNAGEKDGFGSALHATDSPMLVAPLSKKLSSTPRFIPLFPCLPKPEIEIEGAPGILMYVPEAEAQDVKRSRALMDKIRDIPIYVLHGKGKKAISSQDNVVSLDWIEDDDREGIFKKVSIFVRLMNYDGLSQTVVEMKSLGRHVFYTGLAPYCNRVSAADSPETIADKVRSTVNEPLDAEGAEWYRKVFSMENFKRITRKLCQTKGWDF